MSERRIRAWLKRLSGLFSKLKLPGKKREKKERKRRVPFKRRYQEYVEKAGITVSFERMLDILFKAAVVITVLLSGWMLYRAATAPGEQSVWFLIVSILVLWTFAFVAINLVLWLLFYFYIDMRMYQRRVGIEDVFPDFLQLTSANIRAGMAIDQALWHAIRPNFGVLAKEMEDVAKRTMSGTDLEESLYTFSRKYDSKLIQRSLSLLMEGLNAGGEIGELLDRIATNLQESKIMQKEMAASVTTYAIFITFAAIVAAPFLLALSSQLLVIIQNIIGTIDIPDTGGSGFNISFSSVGVTPADFRIFALTTLSLTALLSAAIVATIRKGTVRAGAKYIPIFITTALVIFLILDNVLAGALSGVF